MQRLWANALVQGAYTTQAVEVGRATGSIGASLTCTSPDAVGVAGRRVTPTDVVALLARGAIDNSVAAQPRGAVDVARGGFAADPGALAVAVLGVGTFLIDPPIAAAVEDAVV